MDSITKLSFVPYGCASGVEYYSYAIKDERMYEDSYNGLDQRSTIWMVQTKIEELIDLPDKEIYAIELKNSSVIVCNIWACNLETKELVCYFKNSQFKDEVINFKDIKGLYKTVVVVKSFIEDDEEREKLKTTEYKPIPIFELAKKLDNANFVRYITYNELEEMAFSAQTPTYLAEKYKSLIETMTKYIPNREYRYEVLNKYNNLLLFDDGRVIYSEVG